MPRWRARWDWTLPQAFLVRTDSSDSVMGRCALIARLTLLAAFAGSNLTR